jgi:UDP-N-acetyl-D-glucosamine dehydrogenase
LLEQENIKVTYHDPYIPEYEGMQSEELSPEAISGKDIVIIATPHENIDFDSLISSDVPILDTKNILRKSSRKAYKI